MHATHVPGVFKAQPHPPVYWSFAHAVHEVHSEVSTSVPFSHCAARYVPDSHALSPSSAFWQSDGNPGLEEASPPPQFSRNWSSSHTDRAYL